VVYQIMIKTSRSADWVIFGTPTRDPFTAMRLLREARAQNGHVTVVQASTISELEVLTRRMVRSGMSTATAEEHVGARDETTMSMDEIDRLRWERERGHAGDHDVPYSFSLPASISVQMAWSRLLARTWRQQETNHMDRAPGAREHDAAQASEGY